MCVWQVPGWKKKAEHVAKLLAGLKGTRRIVFPHSACSGEVESTHPRTRYEEHWLSFGTNEGSKVQQTAREVLPHLTSLIIFPKLLACDIAWLRIAAYPRKLTRQAWYRWTSRVRALTHGNAAQPILVVLGLEHWVKRTKPRASFTMTNGQQNDTADRLRTVFLLSHQ